VKIALECLQQEQDYSCVPACIRIVLHHLGDDFSEAEIGSTCKTTQRGTDQDDAAQGLAHWGYEAIKLDGATVDDLVQFLRQNHPVIVFLSVKHLPYGGHSGMHSVVVNGFKTNEVSFIDPARSEEIAVSLETFLNAWLSRGGLGLVIKARSHEG